MALLVIILCSLSVVSGVGLLILSFVCGYGLHDRCTDENFRDLLSFVWSITVLIAMTAWCVYETPLDREVRAVAFAVTVTSFYLSYELHRYLSNVVCACGIGLRKCLEKVIQ